MPLTALQALLSARLRLNAGGQPLFELSLSDAMRIEDDTLVIESGPTQFVSKEDQLVGFPGLRFLPSLVSAGNRKFAASAYSWVNDMTAGWLGKAIAAAMPVHFGLSLTQGFNFWPMTFLQLCSNLYSLSINGAVPSEKLSEIRTQLRGILRVRSQRGPLERYKSVRRAIESANSEVKVARTLSNLGHDAQLGVHPDISIGRIGVEVKNILESFDETPRYIAGLRQRAEESARKQNAQISIFDVGQYFNFSGHRCMQPLSRVIKQAVWRTRKGLVSGILLSYSPLDHSPHGLIL